MGIAQAEAQLAELAAQVAGVRFVEGGGLLGEQVGDTFGLLVVMGGNVLQSQPHLRLDLDRVPPAVHSTDDIRHGVREREYVVRSCAVAATAATPASHTPILPLRPDATAPPANQRQPSEAVQGRLLRQDRA
jgi:hypothetical protein